jgi:hypothetical protein
MRKENDIPGLLFIPSSLTLEEHEEVYKSAKFYTNEKFMAFYREHIIAMQTIAECAKIYILNNYSKVKDWSKLNVIINDNSDESTEYFNYVPITKHRASNSSETGQKLLKRINERHMEKHNPITSITDVVLDPSDGDFSLTINDKVHLWIDETSVIIIADYIEKAILNETNKNSSI